MRKMILLAVCAAAFAAGWFGHKRAVDSHSAQNEPVGDAKVPLTEINEMQVAKSDGSQARIDAKHGARTLYVWVNGTKEEDKHLPGVPKSFVDEPININAIHIATPEELHAFSTSESVMSNTTNAVPAAVFGKAKEK